MGRGSRWSRPRATDVSAGLVTGLFSIPEGLAYASIAGFNPVAGIYAGVVPTLIGSLLSRTVLMVTTLTSAIALTAQSAIGAAGLDAYRNGRHLSDLDVATSPTSTIRVLPALRTS